MEVEVKTWKGGNQTKARYGAQSCRPREACRRPPTKDPAPEWHGLGTWEYIRLVVLHRKGTSAPLSPFHRNSSDVNNADWPSPCPALSEMPGNGVIVAVLEP